MTRPATLNDVTDVWMATLNDLTDVWMATLNDVTDVWMSFHVMYGATARSSVIDVTPDQTANTDLPIICT